MTDPAALSSALIGEIFVERGHITHDQLEEALAAQAQTGELLGEILVGRFGVARVELAGVLAEQWAMMERGGEPAPVSSGTHESLVGNGTHTASPDSTYVDIERRPIGEIFVEHGVVTQHQLDAALNAQGESGQRLGEVLVAQGAITRLELASALAEQWSTLQKIRPPEPKPAEPWQEAAVRAAADSGVDQVPLSTPPADVEHLRDAVKALEERLRTVSATAGSSPPDQKLRETTTGLAARITELEERFQSVATPDLGELKASIDEIRVSLAALQARLDGPNSSVVALERRLETAVDGLLARIETLGGSSADDAALGGLRDSLAGLQERTGDLVARDEVDAIRVALGAVSEQVKELATRTSGPTHEDLEHQISVAVTDLRERLDEVAQPHGGDAIAELRAAVSGIEAQLGELHHQGSMIASGDAVAEIGARVDGLTERVEGTQRESSERLAGLIGLEQTERLALAGSLEEAVGRLGGLDELRLRVDALGSSDEVVRDALQPVEERIATLADQVSGLASSEWASGLEARISELREEEARAREALAARIDDHTASAASAAGDDVAELSARITELRSHLDGLPSADRIGALEHGLAEVREGTQARPSVPESAEIKDLQTAVTDLGARLREVASRPAGVSQDQLERRVADLTAGLTSHVEAVGTGSPDEVASIREAVAVLEQRLGTFASVAAVSELSTTVSEIGSRIEELAVAKADDVVGQNGREDLSDEHIEGLVAAERAAREELARHLSERIEGARTDEQARHELSELRQQIADLGGLREQVAGLAERGDQSDAFAVLESSLVERHEIEAAARGSLEAQLSELRNGLYGLEELRGQVQELSAGHHDVAHQGELDEVRGRLDEVGSRLEGLASTEWVAALERTAGEVSHAVGERLDGLEAHLAGLDRTAELAQLHTLVGDLTARVGGFDAGLSEVRAGIDDSVVAAVRAGLEHTVAPEAIAQLATDLYARLGEIEAAAVPTRAALDELGMRLGATEQHAWVLPEQLDDRFGRHHQELSARIEGVGIGYDAALAAVNARLEELSVAQSSGYERLAGLEHASASANTRLEGIEARSAHEGTVRDQIAALTSRLDTELAVTEERGAAIERAIRKGLAGLGERLTANEATYLESGAALRRSIERLGAAVIEADTRIADMPLDPPQHGFVAFVPTADGYRLRALDGAAPEVGDVVELSDAGQLRVTRVARSPLPLDRRACAYLEYA